MEEIMMPMAGPAKHSVWDNYVPILQRDRHTDVYLSDTIEGPQEYNHLCHILYSAHKGDTIALHINNGGGYVDAGFMIIDAIKASKAVVTAKLTGTVGSISTMITLACDELEMADNTGWLSHNYSGGVQGKGGEMKAQMEFMAAELAATFTSIHTGFFTDDEISNIIDDKDMWMNKTEVVGRWNARKKKDLKALKEIEATRKAK